MSHSMNTSLHLHIFTNKMNKTHYILRILFDPYLAYFKPWVLMWGVTFDLYITPYTDPVSYCVSQVQSDTGWAVCPAVSPGRRATLSTDLLDQEAAILLRALHRGLHLSAQLHLAGAHPALLPHHLQLTDLRRTGQRHCQVHAIWRWAAGVSGKASGRKEGSKSLVWATVGCFTGQVHGN